MKSETRIQTIEFSVEKFETFSIRRNCVTIYGWCHDCAGKVRMLSPDDAAKLIGVPTRRIYLDVEARRVHFFESADGSIFICVRSLRKSE